MVNGNAIDGYGYVWVCLRECTCVCVCEALVGWLIKLVLLAFVDRLAISLLPCAIVYGHDVVLFQMAKQLGNRNQSTLLASHAGSSKRTTNTSTTLTPASPYTQLPHRQTIGIWASECSLYTVQLQLMQIWWGVYFQVYEVHWAYPIVTHPHTTFTHTYTHTHSRQVVLITCIFELEKPSNHIQLVSQSVSCSHARQTVWHM